MLYILHCVDREFQYVNTGLKNVLNASMQSRFVLKWQ